MIIPTLWVLRQALGTCDIHGQPSLKPGTRELVAPVKLVFVSQHTTVRTDSAASHGHANEITSNIVVLARANSKISMGDVLTIAGNKVQVTDSRPRYDVAGKLDHLEIHCSVWK